jgi:CBS domain-containing protein
MQVKDIMTFNVETIDSNASLIEAARKMKELEVGALPVWKNGKLVGMVTDRDITIRAVAEKKNPSTTSVKEIMSSDVCCCFDDDDIHEAARMMEERSIHRLLVTNRNNEPVGFISLSDFAVKSHDEHLTYEVLERISEPACPHR